MSERKERRCNDPRCFALSADHVFDADDEAVENLALHD